MSGGQPGRAPQCEREGPKGESCQKPEHHRGNHSDGRVVWFAGIYVAPQARKEEP